MFLFVPRLSHLSKKSVTSRTVGKFSVSWGATELSEGREAFGACRVAGRTSADHGETWVGMGQPDLEGTGRKFLCGVCFDSKG